MYRVGLDKYDQLKKYVSTFFNYSKNENISSYTQQQILNIQETFFKSNKKKTKIEIFYFEIFLDCEPIDLIDYESQQQKLVQTAVEKWLQT